MDNSAIIEAAKELSQEQLPMRFKPFDIVIRLFIEAFTTKTLLRLFGRPLLKIIPTREEDSRALIAKFQQRFPSKILDPILKPHPIGGVANNDAYMLWLRTNLPDDMQSEDFDMFVFLCSFTKLRWDMRRIGEEKLLRKLYTVSTCGAGLIQTYILFKAFGEFLNGDTMLGLLHITLLLMTMIICMLCFSLNTRRLVP